MAEYIDREKIRLEVCSNCTRQIDLECQYEKPCGELIAAFLNEDPADVAAVMHRKRLKEVYRDSYGADWTRYVCRLFGRVEIKKEPYCNCGAKMDGGEKANE